MKYFVVSDVHGFYTELREGLDRAGYDMYNKDHTLIVCGDVFDRGNETIELYYFLNSIPKDNIILIKGNHEELYLKLLKGKYPMEHDFHNGTVDTFRTIAGSEVDFPIVRVSSYDYYDEYDYDNQFANIISKPNMKYYVEEWKKVIDKVKESPITKWLESDVWVDYAEIDNFIFTHSFIPTSHNGFLVFDMKEYDWRTQAKQEDWYNARWDNPIKMYEYGLFQNEIDNKKTLVSGHYGSFYYHQEFNGDISHEIFYGDNIVGIDSTIVCSNKCNVLVIDNGELYCDGEKVKKNNTLPDYEE